VKPEQLFKMDPNLPNLYDGREYLLCKRTILQYKLYITIAHRARLSENSDKIVSQISILCKFFI